MNFNDPEGVKRIAKRIFELYDKDKNGILDHQELSPMLQAVYKTLSKHFIPSKPDLDIYQHVLDKDNDGKVTLQDIEEAAKRYFLGSNFEEKLILEKTESNSKKGTISPDLENKLEITRRVFGVYDNNKTGFLPLYNLPEMIQQVFNTLGLNKSGPSIENIIQIMQRFIFSDKNKANLHEFEEVFVMCLKESGYII